MRILKHGKRPTEIWEGQYICGVCGTVVNLEPGDYGLIKQIQDKYIDEEEADYEVVSVRIECPTCLVQRMYVKLSGPELLPIPPQGQPDLGKSRDNPNWPGNS